MILRAVGVMSGTSMDGIDVALIETDGRSNVTRLGGAMVPMPGTLKAALLDLLAVPEVAFSDPLASLEQAVTKAHGDAIAAFLGEISAPVDVIGLHGQTVLHRPQQRFTRQLGVGVEIARRFGVRCVDGFRFADVAAGGQGAPFAPLYHQALALGLAQPLAVLNLGGVGNVTYLDGAEVIAFDTGPASALLDDFVARRLGLPFDADGALAASGRADQALVQRFLALPYFAKPVPKSLDRNDFHGLMGDVDRLNDANGAATLAAFTVQSVVVALAHLPKVPKRWLVTGGGRRNRFFMAELARELGAAVEPVEAVGWNGDLMEAELFGYLAVRSLQGLPLSLPTTTGVPFPCLGGRVHHP